VVESLSARKIEIGSENPKCLLSRAHWTRW